MARPTGQPRKPPKPARPFDWQALAGYTFTSKDGKVKARVEETPEGDFHLAIDMGCFDSADDAVSVGNMMLWFALDPHGFARDYEEFPYEIFDLVEEAPVDHTPAEVQVEDDLDDYPCEGPEEG